MPAAPDSGTDWAFGLVSDWHIRPVLSRTSPTQSLVWPQTTVVDAATLTVWMPAMFISVVGIGTEDVTVTDWPFWVSWTAAGVP